MNRKELLEAISHLEYLALNHPDPAKAAGYARELEEYRARLQALDAKSTGRSDAARGAAK